MFLFNLNKGYLMKANPKINDFISDILFVDEKKGEIIVSLRKLILKTFPKTEE